MQQGRTKADSGWMQTSIDLSEFNAQKYHEGGRRMEQNVESRGRNPFTRPGRLTHSPSPRLNTFNYGRFRSAWWTHGLTAIRLTTAWHFRIFRSKESKPNFAPDLRRNRRISAQLSRRYGSRFWDLGGHCCSTWLLRTLAMSCSSSPRVLSRSSFELPPEQLPWTDGTTMWVASLACALMEAEKWGLAHPKGATLFGKLLKQS